MAQRAANKSKTLQMCQYYFWKLYHAHMPDASQDLLFLRGNEMDLHDENEEL